MDFVGSLLCLLFDHCGSAAGSTRTQVVLDGSPSVVRLVEAVASDYNALSGSRGIEIRAQGTGAAVRAASRNEVDIVATSRPLASSETTALSRESAPFVVPLAIDAVAVITHPSVTGLGSLTTAELAVIFGDDSIDSWTDVRSSLADGAIVAFGGDPRSASAELVADAATNDDHVHFVPSYQQLASDAAILAAVAGTPGSVGYVSTASLSFARPPVRTISLDFGGTASMPTSFDIVMGRYELARLVTLTVPRAAMASEDVRNFIRHALRSGGDVAEREGYKRVSGAAAMAASLEFADLAAAIEHPSR